MRFAALTLGLALTAAAASATAGSESTAGAAPCPDSGPDRLPCLAKNGDPRAMYMVGREAYQTGRKSGDLTEALNWAQKAKANGNRSGRMLLKMVYVQMGEGAHADYVQAHKWLAEAIAGGDDYLVAWQRRLEDKMTPEQIERARAGSLR